MCLLRESGFRVFISIVGTPEVLARFSEIAGCTAAIGLSPVPKLLRGPYRGKSYPVAYTADERRTFATWAAIARMSYGNMGFGETPTIDVFGDENYLGGTPEFRGRLCSAGEKFVKLLPDGAVFRCEVNSSNYDAVARLVGIEGGVVSGVFNLESSGVRASDWRPRHDKRYHEA